MGNSIRDLVCESWRDGISYLVKLLCPRSLETVIIRESLQPGGLPNGKASVLARVRVDEIVTVLGDVGGNRRGRSLPALDAESVGELLPFDRVGDVPVVGLEKLREIFQDR